MSGVMKYKNSNSVCMPAASSSSSSSKQMQLKASRGGGGLFLAFVVVALMAMKAEANPDAKRLYDDLLSNYNRLIRPVSNHTNKVTVKLGVRLSQLVDLVRPYLITVFL